LRVLPPPGAEFRTVTGALTHAGSQSTSRKVSFLLVNGGVDGADRGAHHQGVMPRENHRSLRRGDVVEVRTAAEILATLDENGAYDDLPFMPEMLQYVGRRFTVSRRVEKICDTIAATGSRRMHETVYLEDLRCDGSGHGGCQAGCRIYWKEAWLRRVNGASTANQTESDTVRELERRAHASTRTMRELEGEPEEVWRCQATDAFEATEPLKTSNLRQYWRELRSGNFALPNFLFALVRGFFFEVASRLNLMKALPLSGPGTYSKPTEPLDLQPGDLVQVRSKKEIESTLDGKGHLRGLSFDREMLPYCGGTYRVQNRVQRLIDDRTGRMIEIPGDCLILQGVVCSGERSPGRWFCPREIYPYWREAWLRPVEESPKTAESEPPLPPIQH
jgi:hypothetical protein